MTPNSGDDPPSEATTTPPKFGVEDVEQIYRTISAVVDRVNQWSYDHKAEIDAFADHWRRTIEQVRSIAPAFQQIASFVKQQIVPFLDAAADAYCQRLATYPALESKVRYLAGEGWFINVLSLDFQELDALATSELEGDELCAFAENLYRSRFDEFAAELYREFPERRSVIEQAVEAHQAGKYALSVPVFFAQADGVCGTKARKYLFLGGRDDAANIAGHAREKIAVLSEKEGLFDFLEIVMWSPLENRQPVALTKRAREQIGYTGLNRHDVMHGDSSDYGTETNSLKAFSMLCHVAALLATEFEANT